MTDATPKSIALLVDYELMMHLMLKLIVDESAFVIGEATNGEDAITLCRRPKPGLVCLDLNMPKLDGLETLNILQPEFPATVFVIIMADASAAKVKMSIKSGTNGFILKPFNTTQVMERLTYLRRFPFDRLKIDCSFVSDIMTDSGDAAIIKGVIALAHGLDLSVTAEGMETVEQFDFLCLHGCDTLQGYLFARPLAPDQFADLLCETFVAHA